MDDGCLQISLLGQTYDTDIKSINQQRVWRFQSLSLVILDIISNSKASSPLSIQNEQFLKGQCHETDNFLKV
jgi:hypothetical protein